MLVQFSALLSKNNMTKLICKLRSHKTSEGMIPAVLYGVNVENTSIEVDPKSLEKTLEEAGESTLVDLELDKKKYKVLVHDLQRDPLRNKITHVDFYQPDLKETVEVEVPLIFVGEAPAIKLGGTLIKNLSEIEVKALPSDLPHNIEVDISGLTELDSEITIKDLILPKGVKVMREDDEVVAIISPIQEEKEETVNEEEAVQEVAVDKEKKEEETEE